MFKRWVTVRSGQLFEDHPMCLTDFASGMANDTRPVVGMKCVDAVTIGDGREIWLMTSWPILKRWENGENQLLSKMVDEITGPMIRPMSDDSPDGRIEFKNDNTINLRAIDKCISIATQKELEFRCSLNVTAMSSSAKNIKKNSPCNPAMEKPTNFYFNPNDAAPTLTLTIGMKFAFFQKIEVEFTKQVIEVGLTCFSSRRNEWW